MYFLLLEARSTVSPPWNIPLGPLQYQKEKPSINAIEQKKKTISFKDQKNQISYLARGIQYKTTWNPSYAKLVFFKDLFNVPWFRGLPGLVCGCGVHQIRAFHEGVIWGGAGGKIGIYETKQKPRFKPLPKRTTPSYRDMVNRKVSGQYWPKQCQKMIQHNREQMNRKTRPISGFEITPNKWLHWGGGASPNINKLKFLVYEAQFLPRTIQQIIAIAHTFSLLQIGRKLRFCAPLLIQQSSEGGKPRVGTTTD